MYAISNKSREELINLLSALKGLPGNGARVANIKRRAGLMQKKLQAANQTEISRFIKK